MKAYEPDLENELDALMGLLEPYNDSYANYEIVFTEAESTGISRPAELLAEASKRGYVTLTEEGFYVGHIQETDTVMTPREFSRCEKIFRLIESIHGVR